MDLPQAKAKRNSTAAEEANPIKSDPQLQVLVKKLDKVKKYKTFQRWKSNFLDRFDEFLYDKGMEPAEKSCTDLDANLRKLVAKTTKVLDFIHKGDLGEDKKSVKGSLALNEMCTSLENVRGEIETLIPSLKSEERRKGFSKFHLGAALIRQNFLQYVSMKAIEDAVSEIGEKLENVADRQQHELFDYYKTTVQRFCDVLADLNLYAIMLKCIEFSKPPEEEESDDPEYFHVVVEERASDRKLPMEVDARDAISAIKEAIATGLGIPVKRQTLRYKGEELIVDSKTMEELNVQDCDVFFVEAMKINLTVNVYGGEDPIQLQVDPGMLISDLKRELEAKCNISAKDQVLLKSTEELNNPNASLEGFGVEDGGTLELEPKEITINALMPSGDVFPIHVALKDDTPAIKALIESASGMKAGRQVLKHEGKLLPSDGVSVKEMGLKDGTNLDVDIFKIPITVNSSNGKTIELMVDPTSHLSDLKRELEVESEIEASNQCLTRDGAELDDPLKTLQDFNVETDAVLDLEPKQITLHVNMPDGSQVDIVSSPKETSQEIKDRIAGKTGMAVPRQVLKHKGEELPPNVASKNMGLVHGSPIDVEVFKIPIVVDTPSGTFELSVDPASSVLDLKQELQELSGIDPSNQSLSVIDQGGEKKELVDDQTLEKCGVKPGATLTLEPKSVNVDVNLPDGLSINIDVSPDDTGATIKEKIARKSDLEPKRQVLKHNGVDLPSDNEACAREMGLKEGSVIEVEILKIPIKVNVPEGDAINLMVDPTIAVVDLKKTLETDSEIPASNQCLSFHNEELVDDQKSLESIGIIVGSILDLEPKEISLKVCIPNGSEHLISISPRDGLSTIKKLIEEATGMPASKQIVKFTDKELPEESSAKEMGLKNGSVLDVESKFVTIDVADHEGKIHKIDIGPSDEEHAIKHRVEEKTGISPSRQVLKVKDGTELPPNTAARDLGIMEGSELEMSVLKIPVTIKNYDGTSKEIEVEPIQSLGDFKNTIGPIFAISPDNQVLYMSGTELSGDNKTLETHKIKAGSILDLEPKTITISAKMPDGQQKEIEISPSDNGAAIKLKIQEATGLEVARQVVDFADKRILDDDIAKDVGVREGSLLELSIFRIPIHVKTWDDNIIETMVDPTDKLIELKNSLQSESGVSTKNQMIFMNDVELTDDNKRAHAYGIVDGTTLYLEPRYMEVTVSMPDGTSCTFEVSAQSTGDEMKEKVANQTGIVSSRQVLRFADKEILADSTVKGNGIKGGAVIQCSLFKIPITVELNDGSVLPLEIEPIATINEIKEMLEPLSGLAPRKQVLNFIENELSVGERTAIAYGIKKQAVLQLEPRDDPIVFVDVKYGTLFGVDRDDVIEQGILTPNQGNAFEFKEADKSAFGKERLCKAMLDSPNLGVKPQIVVEKIEVEDYDLEEAEQVKSKWGVQLKKTQKNKRGNELIYVDIKSGGFGLADRTKATEVGFITVVGQGKDETLKQAEHNTRIYDKYVAGIREIFGIKATK